MGIFPPCSSAEMVNKVLEMVCGKNHENPRKQKNNNNNKIKGTVVLMKKNVLDMNDSGSSLFDRILEIFGHGVSLQLISSVQTDSGSRGKLGKAANLEKWDGKLLSETAAEEEEDDAAFNIQFEWDESMEIPGAFIIKNHHNKQFFLKTVTLDDVPGHGQLNFICNSWVYPANRYKYNRVFFANKTYLPHSTPETLRPYREEELINLRGNGSGTLKHWDRVYDYAYYNDLGSPEKGEEHARPVLGGSKEYPYPRRGRTGRAPNKKDPKTESRLPLLDLNIYVPRDERFTHVKFSDFISYAVRSLGQVLIPEAESLFDKTMNEFDSFKDVLDLYEDGLKLPDGPVSKELRQCIPLQLVKELIESSGLNPFKFPTPDVIKVDKTAWRTDEEFAREMLAGLNPVVITLLQEFPPASKLDSKVYGNQNSSITKELIETYMNGLTIDQALEENKLFILDHHDPLMPYLRRINKTKSNLYATRTILLLQDDGTLKPLAIELSLPRSENDIDGCTSQVFTPSEHGIEGSFWNLAKAYAAVNDSGYHQLISHWLKTHAVIEPFVIAANRQLSVLHPIYKLLHPHFRDTMNINALARHTLINSGGILELTVYPGKYAMEMSSAIYKDWVFTEQALPADLIKRGMAVPDSSLPHGLKLVIEDYPFAVDGLEIWSAIEEWVKEYCSYYYPTNNIIQDDQELQSWWAELRDIGHGDLKDKEWWPKMQTLEELIQTCTTIIWIASALHAAVNFGQYSYAGYLPNRPTVSRRLLPEPGTPDYAELESNPDLFFLRTITAQFQTLLGVSLIEILSMHSRDEIYLGQTENPKWTADHQPLEAFKRFSERLEQVEEKITTRNADDRLKNRTGPVKFPYTLLYPNTSDYSKIGGLTGKGIPNSVSI